MLFISKTTFAQTHCCPYIKNISIIPEKPTVNDSIKIAILVNLQQNGGSFGTSYYINSDTLNLNACYYVLGGVQAIYPIMDTINIGKHNAGTFILKFNASMSSSIDSCHVIMGQSLADTFDISLTNSIKNDNNSFFKVNLSPNPVLNFLRINSSIAFHQVQIIDLTGRVYPITLSRQEIDVSSFSAGTYLIRLTNEHGSIMKKFIKE